jgi:perosamine synthetase
VALRWWGMSFGASAVGGDRRGLYVRHRLDLSVTDILSGIAYCSGLWGGDLEVLRCCSLEHEGILCLSVRSGWDLWLRANGLRARDEVLVSAVTHPDIVRIIRGHGLRDVPVDIDPETLAPRPWMLEAALTPRTRAVVVAHLFGGRMDLTDVASFAGEHGLLLVEDCAQAFQGPQRMGDPRADVSMYSFGTLKTSTALGGAVLRVRDGEVLGRMRDIQASYPLQGRMGYLQKLLKAFVVVAVSRPRPYGLLARACARFGHDLDALLGGAVRGFSPQEPASTFFQRLRHSPSAPLLAMLCRRLRTFDRERLARRASTGEWFATRLGVGDLHPGRHSLQRTHWLFPVVVADPGGLIEGLQRHGLDASQATSSISVVEAPAGRASAAEASLMMSSIVFLPVYPELPSRALDVMAGLVNDSAARRADERVAL